MMYKEILYSVADYVATITLNRPDRLNARTPQMEVEVRAAVTAATSLDLIVYPTILNLKTEAAPYSWNDRDVLLYALEHGHGRRSAERRRTGVRQSRDINFSRDGKMS